MTSLTYSARSRHAGTAGAVGAAVALFAILFAVVTVALLRQTGGHFTYALDDAYIHMAIAKNLALHGVWGVQADAFSSASSSPLWTALLGVSFKIFGVWDYMPIVLNTVFAVLCIVGLGLILEHEQVLGVSMFAVLAAVICFAPLVPMVWIGMEHTLHILLTLLTAWTASQLAQRFSWRRFSWLTILATFTVATRFEGLFVVAGCAVLLSLAGRMMPAIILAVLSALPVLVVGVWNLSHGWFFLPSSIMMKQTVLPGAPGSSLVMSLVENVARTDAPVTFFALFGTALCLIAYQRLWSRPGKLPPLLVVFVVSALLHLVFAKFGWLYRYESYLMALGVLAVGVSLSSMSRQTTKGLHSRAHQETALIFTLVAVLAGGERTVAPLKVAVVTAGHIYRQQRHMAEFVRLYYDSAPVALNDIGAVSYFTHAKVHDLFGLGSLEAARARHAGRFDAHKINAWLDRDKVEIAIIYDDVFSGRMAFQNDWDCVGSWRTDSTGIVEAKVTFFAREAEGAQRLAANLREFNPQIPPEVGAVVGCGPDAGRR